MGILLLSKIQTTPPRFIWFVPSAYVLFVLHLLKILLPQVRESDKEKRLSILKEAMPLCFLTHKQSEFSPSSLGISRTPIIILPAFFNFAFVLLFFFFLSMCEMYIRKKKILRQRWPVLPAALEGRPVSKCSLVEFSCWEGHVWWLIWHRFYFQVKRRNFWWKKMMGPPMLMAPQWATA